METKHLVLYTDPKEKTARQHVVCHTYTNDAGTTFVQRYHFPELAEAIAKHDAIALDVLGAVAA